MTKRSTTHRPAPERALRPDWYDYPQYYELAFVEDTPIEADFIEAACRRFARGKVRTLLEPGCGGGRLLIELAKRGYATTGFDNHPRMLHYLRRRATRLGLDVRAFAGDMTSFRVRRRFDAAFNTFNTFRHLLSEQAAVRHLRATADALRPGGIYILGFHLLPPDASEECIERWNARRGATRVHFTLRVVDSSRRRRIERLRVVLRVRTPKRDFRTATEFPLRLYTARQFVKLLAQVPEFELCETYDFGYEIDHPMPLDDSLSDAVFVLRRRNDAPDVKPKTSEPRRRKRPTPEHS